MTKNEHLPHARRANHTQLGAKWVCSLLILASPMRVSAQTWVGNRQSPSLREIAVVDQTGETDWLWGSEDVAGNGLNQFPTEEQAIDARSVYLRLDNGRLWWRTYVSASNAPDANLTAYLFVDSDLDSNTGLGSNAREIDAALDTDPTPGGYEYVLSVKGDGTQPRLWEVDAAGVAFVEATVNASQLDVESNVARDPLRIGANLHGYVQANLVDNLMAISTQCQARFYVRTTNQTAGLGPGDLDVGEAVYCTPADTNTNQVPDVIEPAAECRTGAQCPNAGICWNGRCWLASVCTDDTDCARTEYCNDGRCLVTNGSDCRSNSDCGSELCDNGRCVVCASDGACGAGRVCAPDGRCVDEAVAGPAAGGTGNNPATTAGVGGVVLGPGERIEGGACACRLASLAASGGRSGWFLMLAGFCAGRLRRRRIAGGQQR
jgi:hypothetical protein